ncbi:hypothetical protein [Streptomyces sp. NPDC055400]
MAKILGTVRTKVLTQGLPAVLNDLDENGNLRQGSTLRPKRSNRARTTVGPRSGGTVGDRLPERRSTGGLCATHRAVRLKGPPAPVPGAGKCRLPDLVPPSPTGLVAAHATIAGVNRHEFGDGGHQDVGVGPGGRWTVMIR